MGWGEFWQVLADGLAFATVGYWAAPFMLAAACWVGLTTPDAVFRGLLLGLGTLGVVSLVSIASIQVVPKSLLRLPLLAPLLMPPIAFIAHMLLLVPGGASRGARLAWAAANLTFITRSLMFLGAFV
ncbi:hypothetical protein [Phenylobacterium sp.]|uniref:hypothetical protein n=1 Tax=Phenylobacterium sp. TaxID=1871053 RepID=UPI0027358FEB|nr:hypothetical protein [Phenylobacterium sp.]MDP3590711.1 hypothetical protein [Phenylobacterium sp.]